MFRLVVLPFFDLGLTVPMSSCGILFATYHNKWKLFLTTSAQDRLPFIGNLSPIEGQAYCPFIAVAPLKLKLTLVL